MSSLLSMNGAIFESKHGTIEGEVSCGVFETRCRKNNKIGFCNINNDVCVPFMYNMAYAFDQKTGQSRVFESDGAKLINLRNEAIMCAGKDDIGYMHDNRIRYKTDGLYGFCDQFGRPIIERHFSYAQDFACGLAAVQYPNQDEYYYINSVGAIAHGPYDSFGLAEAGYSSSGIAVHNTDRGTSSIIDVNGKTTAVLDELYITSFKDWTTTARRSNGRHIYIDIFGNQVILDDFNDARRFLNGYARVMRENRWALCDIHGGIVTVENPNFEPCSFTNGLLRAKHISGRFVFTDFAYNNIFQRDYVWASDFSEGYALVDI